MTRWQGDEVTRWQGDEVTIMLWLKIFDVFFFCLRLPRKQARGSPEAGQGRAGGSPGSIRRYAETSKGKHKLRMQKSFVFFEFV